MNNFYRQFNWNQSSFNIIRQLIRYVVLITDDKFQLEGEGNTFSHYKREILWSIRYFKKFRLQFFFGRIVFMESLYMTVKRSCRLRTWSGSLRVALDKSTQASSHHSSPPHTEARKNNPKHGLTAIMHHKHFHSLIRLRGFEGLHKFCFQVNIIQLTFHRKFKNM